MEEDLLRYSATESRNFTTTSGGNIRRQTSTSTERFWGTLLLIIWCKVTIPWGYSSRNTTIQGVSKRALQLWKRIEIYTEDIHNVLNCQNVAKHAEFYLECSYHLCLQMSLNSELELLPQLQKWRKRCYVACGKRLTTGGTSAALPMEVTLNHNYPR